MSELLNNAIRLGLSISLLDRDFFIKNVSEMLELYKNDPEKMEKIANGLYKYLEGVRDRMNTQSMFTDIVDHAELPTSGEINDLKKAIEKLANGIDELNKQKQ